MTKVKGSHRGIDHPIAEDAALIGDTRHPLHHASLPKFGHPYDAKLGQKASIPNTAPGDEARDDDGCGQSMPSDGSY